MPNTFDKAVANIVVTTDNPTGYNTKLSTSSSSDTCLRRTTDGTNCADATNIIASSTGTVAAPSILSPGQWGVSVATIFSSDPSTDPVWFAVPSNIAHVTINDSANPTSDTGDSQTLTIGAKTDYALPASTTSIDNYTGSVVITVTANAYTPPAAPTITSITPTIGTTTENKAITITGTNLDTAYQVFIDLDSDGIQDTGPNDKPGEACTNANITDPTSSTTTITCDLPSETSSGLTITPGTYDIVVKTWGGVDTLTNAYTYKHPLPAVPTTVPANNATNIPANTTTITVTSTTANTTCMWGTASGSYPNASGATRTTTIGTNTLYYSCRTGTGTTQSDARTGQWSYTGVVAPPSQGDAMTSLTPTKCAL
ncbi:MAG: IPT/TIG domain-containing protein, partial [Candidatus Nomurabacteria bacterium]|nr:IPT/TIG domain-containing protein [Candidatus Nomurabacteria bacterium]